MSGIIGVIIDKTKILVAGAGAVGSWLGAALAAEGMDVTFLGRAATQVRLGGGLAISGLGAELTLAQPKVVASTDEAFDYVILACKRQDTRTLISSLSALWQHGPAIMVAQNGLGAAEQVKALTGCAAYPLMVPFNLQWLGAGLLHQGTGGQVVVPQQLASFAPYWHAKVVADMAPILAGKLLLNLNNAINGLCGLPLVEELSTRGYRQVLAAAQREALAVFAKLSISPARLTGAPPSWLPRVLEMPDSFFKKLAKGLLAMDSNARSSLYDDLAGKRPTEVDYLNGWVAEQAEHLGLKAPVNRHLAALVHQAEQQGQAPQYAPADLWP